MPNDRYKPAKEIWDEKNRFNFDELLKPYIEGGAEPNPVKRTVGTILDYLINKKRYPVDVAGAAFLIVFKGLFDGHEYKGDGTYGSKGRELVTAIRLKCDEINQQRLRSQTFETIAGARLSILEELIWDTSRRMMPKIFIPIAPASWRWLRRRKKRKADNANNG